MASRKLQGTLFAMLVVLAACTDGPVDAGLDAGGPEQSCAVNAMGGCVLDSEACSADLVTTRGDLTCATCLDDGAGEIEICGVAVEARCIEQENAFGDACQRCVTDVGQVLYDDCFVSGARQDGLVCESASLESPAPDGPNNPDDPDEPAAPVLDDTTSCEVCRDESGAVVSTRCTPIADACEEVIVAGRPCMECTSDGVVVSRECAPLDIDPRVCVSYADDDGVCVDCYGAFDELLTHECVIGGVELAYCVEERTAEGYTCSRCFSSTGFLVDEQCFFSPPAALFCQALVFTEQTCTACVGEQGELVSIDCWLNDCAVTNDVFVECPPPPPCEMRFGDDGSICRICLAEIDGTLVEERQCIGDAPLECFEEVLYVEQAPDEDGDGFNEPGDELRVQNCLVCVENGVEVYRQCEDVGVAQPPVCEVYIDENGAMCEVCFDQMTQTVVYASCPGEVVCYDEVGPENALCTTCYDSFTGVIVDSSCGAAICASTGTMPVVDENGVAVKHPAPPADGSEPTDLLASCTSCGGNALSDQAATCTVLNACGDVTASDPNFAPEPVPACGETVVLALDMTQCERPWGDGYSDVDEALRVIAWGATELGVLFHAASISWPSAGQACESCDCLSGARLDVVVAAADVEAVLSSSHGFFVQ